MSAVEPARHALYSRLEDVLGREHAETLMTHLPQDLADQAATKSDISDLWRGFDERFERFEAKFDAKFNGLEGRFEGLETRFEGLEARFEGLETRFDRLEARFDRLEARFEGLETRFDRLEDRMDRIEDRMDRNQRFYVGVSFGTLTAMTAIFSVVVGLIT